MTFRILIIFKFFSQLSCKEQLPGFTKVGTTNKWIQSWDSYTIDSIAGSSAFCTAKGLSLQSAAGSVEYDDNGNEIKKWTTTCFIRCDEPTTTTASTSTTTKAPTTTTTTTTTTNVITTTIPNINLEVRIIFFPFFGASKHIVCFLNLNFYFKEVLVLDL
jgi:hypothetical protein